MADNQTEKQKVQELTDKLERGLTELFNSDSYKNYLSTMSKFHNYSFNNVNYGTKVKSVLHYLHLSGIKRVKFCYTDKQIILMENHCANRK